MVAHLQFTEKMSRPDLTRREVLPPVRDTMAPWGELSGLGAKQSGADDANALMQALGSLAKK
jgi:hypothetical protein